MGSWPTGTVSTVNVDSATDLAGLARAEIKDGLDKLNSALTARGDVNGVCDLDASQLVPESRLGHALKPTNNLADVASVSAARNNLGFTTVGTNVVTAASAAAGLAVLGGVPSAGGTITGDILQGGSPLATEAYVDANSAGTVLDHTSNYLLSVAGGAWTWGIVAGFSGLAFNDFIVTSVQVAVPGMLIKATVASSTSVNVAFFNANVATFSQTIAINYRIFKY